MRVFITGIGIQSPLARGAQATMQRLLAGDSAIDALSLFSMVGLRSDRAAEIAGLDVAEVVSRLGGVPPWSRTDAMAVLAAEEAIAGAGLDVQSGVELFVGGSTGGMFECETVLAELKRDIGAAVATDVLKTHPFSSASDCIHQTLGPFRRTTAVCSACSGGASAIILAANAIRQGRVNGALAGGVDALCRLTYAGFTALGAVDSVACRPFDVARAGLSLGEGAAFVMLESASSVRKRGATPLVELAGWSIASEAHHITHPEPSGATAAEVMRRAIAGAGLTPGDIDYVNAHGTATPHNDPMEAAAVARCFGEHTANVWVSSIKGAIGHCLGAAAAIEAAVTTMIVADGAIPPTVGLDVPDDACQLRHVRQTQHTPVRAAISNAFGFGGTDTALVFRSPRLSGAEDVARPSRRVAITGAGCIGPLGFFGGDGFVAPATVCAYLDAGPRPSEEPCELPKGTLEMMRARRLDRASRMVTIVAQAALRQAASGTALTAEVSAKPDGVPSRTAAEVGVAAEVGTGIVVGTAHGGVSATAHVIRRIFEKGPKYASPVHFPCVLPSAQASHPSIYLGLTGPALACTDLSTSGEAAFMIAVDMIQSGVANKFVVAAVDEYNEVACKVSGPRVCGVVDRGARSEGAAALVVESFEAAGDRRLAEVVWSAAWRGEAPSIPAPTGRGLVCQSRGATQPVLGWQGLPHHVVADRAGDHESVGGIALVVAVAALHAKDVDEVLLIGHGVDRGYAWILRR